MLYLHNICKWKDSAAVKVNKKKAMASKSWSSYKDVVYIYTCTCEFNDKFLCRQNGMVSLKELEEHISKYIFK